MKLNKQISDVKFCPYIKTEETIYKLLISDLSIISDKYELMPYPLAHWINTIGIEETNRRISSIKSECIRVFVCQHISVDKVSFSENDIVFSPHTDINDGFISIPHYSVNYDVDLIKNDKKYHFSFMGSTKTHSIRKHLVSKYTDRCFDSNVYWGLDNNLNINFNSNYIKLLGDSYFSLCPRGAGISSVRLFESMAMNSIPVIIADGYEKPLYNILDWDEFSVTINENDINKIPEILSSYSKSKIYEMQIRLSNIYNEYFSNEVLHKSIIENLINNI